jgi:hypothetical protein
MISGHEEYYRRDSGCTSESQNSGYLKAPVNFMKPTKNLKFNDHHQEIIIIPAMP